MTYRLGILSTHPIQYYVPLYRHLNQLDDVDLTVFYCHKPSPEELGVGFNVAFDWDIDLVSGYSHVWLKNKSKSPSLQKFNGCDTPAIVNIIQKGKFDAFLVLGWYTKSMRQAMKACWDTKTPVLVRGDSHLRRQTPFYKKIIKRLVYPRFIRRFSCCLAVGQWSEEYFTHYQAKKIIRSPHFVNNEWFEQQVEKNRPELAHIQNGWHISAEKTVFLFAGKFEEKKRPMDFVHAVRILQTELCPDRKIHGLMVGDGPLREVCEELVKSHKIPITFTGFLNQTEIPRAYLTADVLVLPSTAEETWGLVVNEAMACGLPVIVSDKVGSGPDLVKPNKTGLIYPIGDTQALSKAMRTFIDKSSVREMGNAAKAHIANYSIKRASDAIMMAIKSSS